MKSRDLTLLAVLLVVAQAASAETRYGQSSRRGRQTQSSTSFSQGRGVSLQTSQSTSRAASKGMHSVDAALVGGGDAITGAGAGTGVGKQTKFSNNPGDVNGSGAAAGAVEPGPDGSCPNGMHLELGSLTGLAVLKDGKGRKGKCVLDIDRDRLTNPDLTATRDLNGDLVNDQSQFSNSQLKGKVQTTVVTPTNFGGSGPMNPGTNVQTNFNNSNIGNNINH